MSIAKFPSQGTIDISIEYNLALIENNIVEIENKEKLLLFILNVTSVFFNQIVSEKGKVKIYPGCNQFLTREECESVFRFHNQSLSIIRRDERINY